MILKVLINSQKLDPALSFATYLSNNFKDLNLGTINGLLNVYYELGKKNKLTSQDKIFVMEIYKYLFDKYGVLDSKTCESLLHALCLIDEWKICIKLIDHIKFSSKPSHSAYSTLIAALFRNNKKAEAFKMIEKSIEDDRSLMDIAYEEWVNYILRKYKEKKTILKYLEEINTHLCKNCVTISSVIANKLKQTYETLNWTVTPTQIRKYK